MSLSEDPVINTILNGVKEDLNVTLANKRLRATVILVYCGIDAMAFLDMPEEQSEVRRADFVRWCDRYIRFPCKEQLTGADLYGARCAMLHSYSGESKMSREGKCRVVGYMHESIPQVRYAPQIDPGQVLVCVKGLKEAFFRGIDDFLVYAFAKKDKAKIVEQRMRLFNHQYEFSPATCGEGAEPGHDAALAGAI